MWSRQRYGRTDGQTDGRTTCRGNTVLCVASRGNKKRCNIIITITIITTVALYRTYNTVAFRWPLHYGTFTY